ncbi:hypothetical protein [Asticcacaulis sp. EMRT-3]|uniref:hypothetical protein n=1 Tax=Asticcacaulis sp. EMRT-3 TaxID=3040349 RepID=UPI0024AF3EBF|nr:hypothetical protein [Asticcacaulis sp. EMRT-3]MDI7775693.1 hypothetical protein [Asticcacaulis sp. EMRT-3]
MDMRNGRRRIDFENDTQIDEFDQLKPSITGFDFGNHALVAVPFPGEIILAQGKACPRLDKRINRHLVKFARKTLGGTTQCDYPKDKSLHVITKHDSPLWRNQIL